jgi:dienelactone hydrolase
MRLFSAAAWVLLVWPSSAAAQSAAPYTTEIVSIPSGSLKLRGVLGRPAGPGPFPAYISNHGSMTIQEAGRSPWTVIAKGSLSDTLAQQGFVALVLARRGYKGSEGAASTYSQNQTSGGYSGRRAADVMRGAEEEAGDVVAALEYLLTLPSVDPERVAVGGVSLGGLVSIMAAARDTRFKAVISMAGGYRQGGQGGVDEAWPLVQGVWKNGAQKIRAPILILWSKNDMIIDEDEGRQLEKELRRLGRSVEMKVYPAFRDNGHFLFTRAEGYPVYVPDAVSFLETHLKR